MWEKYGWIIYTIDYFRQMEEVVTPCRQKYQKVEHKIEMLAQSKLQNLSESTLKQTQDKIDRLEKRVADQVTAQEAKARDYRLKLTSFRDHAQEIQQKLNTALIQRSSHISQLKQEIDKIMLGEAQQRIEKQDFCQQNCQEKMEKMEKQMLRLKIDKKEQIEGLHQHISEAIREHQDHLESAGGSLDQVLAKKMDNVCWQCNGLREAADKESEKRERGEKDIMEFLRGVVSEMKGLINEDRGEREKNRDKLRLMIQEATRNLALDQ